MSEPFDDMKFDTPATRSAAESGLASLLLGGILAILAMLMLQINLRLFLSPPIWGASDLRMIHHAAVGGVVVLLGIGIVSMILAVRSLFAAARWGQSSALGLAGLLVSVLAILLWIGALADLFSVLDTMFHRQGIAQRPSSAAGRTIVRAARQLTAEFAENG